LLAVSCCDGSRPTATASDELNHRGVQRISGLSPEPLGTPCPPGSVKPTMKIGVHIVAARGRQTTGIQTTGHGISATSQQKLGVNRRCDTAGYLLRMPWKAGCSAVIVVRPVLRRTLLAPARHIRQPLRYGLPREPDGNPRALSGRPAVTGGPSRGDDLVAQGSAPGELQAVRALDTCAHPVGRHRRSCRSRRSRAWRIRIQRGRWSKWQVVR